jgi:DNA-directed RNA polymerase II subunit RPB2
LDTNKNVELLLDLYFQDRSVLYNYIIQSYHDFIEQYIPYILKQNSNVQDYVDDSNNYHNICLEITNIRMRPPHQEGTDNYMSPTTARNEKQTYSGTLLFDITQVDNITNLSTGETQTIEIDSEKNYQIKIPVMVNSKFCSTNIKPEFKDLECSYDPGCYFIVKGTEKTVISIEKTVTNKPIVYEKSNSSYEGGKMLQVMLNSQLNDLHVINYFQILRVFLSPDNSLMYESTAHFKNKKIPLVTLLRAMGMDSDKEIAESIIMGPAESNPDMCTQILYSFQDAVDHDGNLIRTREEAENWLISEINSVSSLKKYKSTDVNQEERIEQKKLHLAHILEKDTLPHIKGGLPAKTKYLCYLANKLLTYKLNNLPNDDRDCFDNKLIKTPGYLLASLFKMYWIKVVKETRTFYKSQLPNKKKATSILNKIRQGLDSVELGIKGGLATGNWGNNTTSEKGVARLLERLNYLNAISNYRRLKTSDDASKQIKSDKMRNVKSSQCGYVCYVETPEGEHIGLDKNLAMMASVTCLAPMAEESLRIWTKSHECFLELDNVPITSTNNYLKMFIEGEWVGYVTGDLCKFVKDIHEAKRTGVIHYHTSIELDIDTQEIRTYTGAGRIVRPLLVVDPNTLETNLEPEIIHSLQKWKQTRYNEKQEIDPLVGKIGDNTIPFKHWDDMLLRHPHLVEWVSLNQSIYSLIADSTETLQKTRQILDNKNAKLNAINKYSHTYQPYQYREFHFSMTTGITVANIPFMNRNQAPRNSYQYGQARQSNGIYATNYRNRFDASFISYHPEAPIVNTKPSYYLGTDKMVSGQNVVCAIMPYTGFNQEDSVIINETAVKRGLFVSTAYKKEIVDSEKNHSTCLDDEFKKPIPEETSAMNQNHLYEKLGTDGVAPKETIINPKEALIGRVTTVPLTNEEETKPFLDNSKFFRGPTSVTVDDVLKAKNDDDYDMIKLRLRSVRPPIIGDKFASRHAQKGTCGLLLRAEDMPYTSDGVVPDIIINENCIPSRMTLGQLLETLTGKVGAMEGMTRDGTSFGNHSPYKTIKELDELIKKLGKEGDFDSYGNETMYSGMTGERMDAKIFIGPTYYQRLKHMVLDKMHARASGTPTILTRQPPEGRQKDGGLRWGEMERDCGIAHGLGCFVKERMLECSDKYECRVCRHCGLLASKMKNNNVWYCKSCDNYSQISTVEIPYAFKLMMQELQSVNIAMRLKTDNEHSF